MKATVLVTGARGFIGRHVARAFANDGHFVIGIGHGTWAREEWRRWGVSDWHMADVKVGALRTYAGRPDLIIHCAGSASVGLSFENPIRDFERSVDTTVNVLDFAREYAPTARHIVLSSASVYGEAQRLPIGETDELAPVSPYGVHKRIVEQLCKEYVDYFGLTVSVLRLFSVYGVGLQKQLLWDACKKVSRSDYSFFGTGRELRDWIHVHDVASLVRSVALHPATPFDVYNGGTGDGVTVARMLEMLFRGLGITTGPCFTGIAKEGDPVGYVADITKARALGWHPNTSLEQGVTEYAAWYAGK